MAGAVSRRRFDPPVALRAALLLAALAVALPTATAQEGAASGDEAPRRLLLLFEVADTAQLDPAQTLLLYESLLVKLGRASEMVAVLEHGDEPSPASDSERSQAARSRRGDAWLHVRVDGRWSGLTLSARAYDLLADAPAFELSWNAAIRRGAIELERHFWAVVTEAVAQQFRSGGRKVARAVSRETLTIAGVPGTRIRGLGDAVLEIDEGGQAALDLLLPATLSYRATRTGYYPVERGLYLEPGIGILDLEQERGSRWALNAYLQMMNYPGFDVSFYPVPNLYWIKLGFNTYLLGLVLAEERDQSMLVSYSLSHVNLSTGVYLNAADRLFRFYVGAGIFARIMTAREWAVYLEPIAPWGLQPILGMEFSRQTRTRFYVEYAPFFYWTVSASLFWLSLPLEHRAPYLPIIWQDYDQPAFYWEIFNFRFGIRWLL